MASHKACHSTKRLTTILKKADVAEQRVREGWWLRFASPFQFSAHAAAQQQQLTKNLHPISLSTLYSTYVVRTKANAKKKSDMYIQCTFLQKPKPKNHQFEGNFMLVNRTSKGIFQSSIKHGKKIYFERIIFNRKI